MKIEKDNYTVEVTNGAGVTLSGTLRLQGREEYQQIYDLLMETAGRDDSALTIDMMGLTFLNSSGISTLSLFVIEMRKRNKPIRIVGNKRISWQIKSLRNFQRLYADVEIAFK